ncbi:hypothetical protein Plhal304r1_c055g0141251 [Plasmopara halstedii]
MMFFLLKDFFIWFRKSVNQLNVLVPFYFSKLCLNMFCEMQTESPIIKTYYQKRYISDYLRTQNCNLTSSSFSITTSQSKVIYTHNKRPSSNSTWDLIQPHFWYPMSSLEQSMISVMPLQQIYCIQMLIVKHGRTNSVISIRYKL